MSTQVMPTFMQGGFQHPGRCDRCLTEACGQDGVTILEKPEDPWGHMQFGNRCIAEMAHDIGYKPPFIYEKAVAETGELLLQNTKLQKELDDLKARHAALRAELVAGDA